MDPSSAAQRAAADIGLLDALRLETAAVAGGAIVLLVLANLLLTWLGRRRRVPSFVRHASLIGLTLVALVAMVLTLKDPVRDQALKFLGVLFSAVLAFSATTVIGNGLAGLMLRAQRHFRGGDWVRVGEHFGQVSHRGLFFTTVQDEFGDLVTLPNTFLLSHPLTVTQEPTYVSAEVSLGYDVPRAEVERLLLEAAEAAGLEKPYVYVLGLGDFAVVYRVSGKLMKTAELLTSQSDLKCRMLDALHAGGIEIVSPNFMNQRLLEESRRFIPSAAPAGGAAEPERGPAPEAETFSEGRRAREVEKLEGAARKAQERAEAVRKELQECDTEERREQLRADLEKLERGRELVEQQIKEKRAESENQ